MREPTYDECGVTTRMDSADQTATADQLAKLVEKLRAENAALQRWKVEAIEIFTAYDDIAETFPGVLGSMKTENLRDGIAALRASRAELLAACKAAKNSMFFVGMPRDKAIEMCRAAIANTEATCLD